MGRDAGWEVAVCCESRLANKNVSSHMPMNRRPPDDWAVFSLASSRSVRAAGCPGTFCKACHETGHKRRKGSATLPLVGCHPEEGDSAARDLTKHATRQCSALGSCSLHTSRGIQGRPIAGWGYEGGWTSFS